MPSVVLDASALLALLRNEPGANIVAAAVGNAVMSTANWPEVLQKMVQLDGYSSTRC
jgi:ribonuclease VapC